MDPQDSVPYAEALRAHDDLDWLRQNVPGYSAAGDRFAAQAGFIGESPLRMDVPPLLEGIDLGPASPLERAQHLAAEAWGARHTWFLTNGASQGNGIATLAGRSLGETLVVQRSVHSSVIDGLVISGLRAAFVHPPSTPRSASPTGSPSRTSPKRSRSTRRQAPPNFAAYALDVRHRMASS